MAKTFVTMPYDHEIEITMELVKKNTQDETQEDENTNESRRGS